MEQGLLMELLKALASPDNEVRRQAEQRYEELKTRETNSLMLGLCGLWSTAGASDEMRLQGAVLMRNYFRGSGMRSQSGGLSGETLEALKSLTLEGIEKEEESLVLRNLCDVVSELGQSQLVSGNWPELKSRLIAYINSENGRLMSAGFRILGELLMCFQADFLASPQNFVEMVNKGLLFAAGKVQVDTIQFISRVVEENNKIHKLIMQSVPLMNQALLRVLSLENELATSAIESYIIIAETDTGFFKLHLADTLNTAFNIANSYSLNDDLRQLAVEFLLCCAEDKPKTICAIPSFVPQIVKTLMDFVVSINGEEFTEWMESDAENRDAESHLYDMGEEGLDRIAKALEDQPNANVVSHVLNIVDRFVNSPDWIHQFGALMAVAQTVEYLPDDSLEEYIDAIVKIVLERFDSPHCQVRFAACQALGQLSLDHQPYVQERYHAQVLPALLKIMNDPHQRVQSHACSAFVNFAEEVEAKHLAPYTDSAMELLFMKIRADTKTIVVQQAITGIAVLAGVTGGPFVKYYPMVMPLLISILTSATMKEARTCRGKAIECMSIIALSIGKEACGSHANEMLNHILPIWASDLDPDDPVKEYAQEAISRFARTLQEDFAQYLPLVIPPLLKTLQQLPSPVSEGMVANADPEDMTYLMIADKCMGLKTSLIEAQEQDLALLGTLVDVLQKHFKDYIQPCMMAILPLLNYVLSDDIKHAALAVYADLIKVTRLLIDEHGGERTMLTIALKAAVDKVFMNLDETLAIQTGVEQDLDSMVGGASGLRQCIVEAGSGVLDTDTLQLYVEKCLYFLNQSSIRRRKRCAQKGAPDFDEDEVANIQDEERQEQAFRSAVLEIIGGLMKTHPKEFVGKPLALCAEFVAQTLPQHSDPDDRTLALYVCDDIIEQLGRDAAPWWTRFLDEMLLCLDDRKPAVRQAAAYGFIHAAQHPEFASYAQSAARQLALLINRDRENSAKDVQLASDNAVAALGEIIKMQSNQLQNKEELLTIWANYLPLKGDEDEAQRVHADLVRLVAENNPILLGPSNSNIPKLVATFASIYKTGFSNNNIDSQIRALVEQLGEQVLVDIAHSLTKKQRNKLQKICKDISELKNSQ